MRAHACEESFRKLPRSDPIDKKIAAIICDDRGFVYARGRKSASGQPDI